MKLVLIQISIISKGKQFIDLILNCSEFFICSCLIPKPEQHSWRYYCRHYCYYLASLGLKKLESNLNHFTWQFLIGNPTIESPGPSHYRIAKPCHMIQANYFLRDFINNIPILYFQILLIWELFTMPIFEIFQTDIIFKKQNFGIPT